MNHICVRVAGAATLCLLLLSSAVPVARGDILAIEQLYQAGKYQDALKAISDELAQIKRDSDKGERYQLLMLRGECLLHIDRQQSAQEAFNQAVKSAGDPKLAAVARANALLVRASPNNTFKPKAGGEPLDILNADMRKQAYIILRDELRKQNKGKLDKAENATTLPPMFDALPAVMDLGYLEFAANGSAPETKEMLVGMGKHAREMINSELRKMKYRLDALEDVANSSVGYGRGGNDMARRGLTSTEQRDLAEAITYLKQIEQTAREARRRAMELGFDGVPWEPVIADAADLIDHAQALLDIGKY